MEMAGYITYYFTLIHISIVITVYEYHFGKTSSTFCIRSNKMDFQPYRMEANSSPKNIEQMRYVHKDSRKENTIWAFKIIHRAFYKPYTAFFKVLLSFKL